ncbi:YraN family protein [Pseudooceanicola nanhaiensis]|uniref:YraN family protein n=1 Tax=Pseudooceanicola nanhaiensis TaxID=375761 RepID=UPI001CD59F92|nr:YraN family protein [Pseudooceanicola nanhaiensis]MCA0919429.1 YraN family protein [Pseudooceanicola nanhaiensis]
MSYSAPFDVTEARQVSPTRRARGQGAYAGGLAAEETVLRAYQRGGSRLLARRFRGRGGEIDLVLRDASGLVFVEVKQGRDFDRAASRLRPAQMRRIEAAALEYRGRYRDADFIDMRIDVALVDGQGAVQILENAFAYC